MKLQALFLLPLLLAACMPASPPPATPPGMPLDPGLMPSPSGNNAVTHSTVRHETTVR